MFYDFPIIRTIDDVLPHVEGRSEFIVADKGDYVVINYSVAANDTFNMEGPDDLGGAIRRECRGLIFYPDGRLMSRPFHKFFNVNEREETISSNVDVSAPHVVMEKLDGSMIRPVMIGNTMRLGTKMGVTEIAEEAEKWLFSKSSVAIDWVRDYVDRGYTPIFEWIGPSNKNVIDYPEHKLVLLAIRDNLSGDYFMPEFNIFETPEFHGSVSDGLGDYIAKHRNDEGREGFVLRFANGHMLKIKSERYLRIHRTKDRIRTERRVLEIILNKEVDDLVGLLDEGDLATVRDVEERFWKALNDKNDYIYGLYHEHRKKDKKTFALEVAPTLKHKEDARFLFAMLDGKITSRPELLALILAHAFASVTKTDKFERMKVWMGME